MENYDYSSCRAYFITICTKDRKRLFWKKEQPDFVGEDIILPPANIQLSPIGKTVDEAILSITTHYPNIELMQYVIMPNHVHMILVIPYDGGSLSYDPTADRSETGGRMISSPTAKGAIITAMGQMKRKVSRTIGIPIWQKSFHDHIIRNREDYEELSKYIYENPIRWQYDCFYTADDEMR